MTNFCSTASSISGNLEEKVKCLHLGSVSLLAGNMFVIESFIACKYEKWQVLYRLLYTCVCVHTLYVLRTALRNSIIFFSFLLRMLYSLLLLLHFHLFRENIKRRDAIVNKSRESTNVHRRDLPGRPFFFPPPPWEKLLFFFSTNTQVRKEKGKVTSCVFIARLLRYYRAKKKRTCNSCFFWHSSSHFQKFSSRLSLPFHPFFFSFYCV